MCSDVFLIQFLYKKTERRIHLKAYLQSASNSLKLLPRNLFLFCYNNQNINSVTNMEQNVYGSVH